ncbi:hypothetical protein BG000_008799, partial [Podila horticola]
PTVYSNHEVLRHCPCLCCRRVRRHFQVDRNPHWVRNLVRSVHRHRDLDHCDPHRDLRHRWSSHCHHHHHGFSDPNYHQCPSQERWPELGLCPRQGSPCCRRRCCRHGPVLV